MQREPKLARVAVIGAGAAGRRFALRCLQAGYEVVLEDVLPEKLRRAAAEQETMPGSGSVLTLVTSVEDAVREADLAIDFVPDELESKLEIFSMLDRMAPPRTVLLTPTNVLSIADLASCTYRPERCFSLGGAEYLEPAETVTLSHPAIYDATSLEGIRSLLRSLELRVAVRLDEMPTLLTSRR